MNHSECSFFYREASLKWHIQYEHKKKESDDDDDDEDNDEMVIDEGDEDADVVFDSVAPVKKESVEPSLQDPSTPAKPVVQYINQPGDTRPYRCEICSSSFKEVSFSYLS